MVAETLLRGMPRNAKLISDVSQRHFGCIAGASEANLRCILYASLIHHWRYPGYLLCIANDFQNVEKKDETDGKL